MLLALAGSVLPAVHVAGHEGGELAISIPVERVAPGDDLPVIGEDWRPTEVLEVSLQQGANVIDLGSVRTGSDGHFVQSIPLPTGLTPGPATIEVASTAGVRARAVITIDPKAPPPSFQPSGAGRTSASLEEGIDSLPFVALLGAILALGILVLRLRTRGSKGTGREV